MSGVDASSSGKPASPIGRFLAALDAVTDLATAVVLAAGGLLTAWAGYQASLWDGEQAAFYAQAGQQRVEASRAASDGAQLLAIDVQMFTAWLSAYTAGEDELQTFYRNRFRAEFKPPFELWLAAGPRSGKGPPTPFTAPGYDIAPRERSKQLEREADVLFEKGQRANEIGDSFTRATVSLASAMFFAGIAQVFDRPRLRMALTALAVLLCIWGTIRVLALPVAS
jgi:hypothetical protein